MAYSVDLLNKCGCMGQLSISNKEYISNLIYRNKQITGRYYTKHVSTLTPAGAESDLNATANGA